MKLAFQILALCSMSIFAFAQESTTPPPRVYPVALPNYDGETATRLQIFLDNSDFGPGKIDGKMGEFFRKALISYKHALAIPKTGAVDSWLLDQVPATYTTYTFRNSIPERIGSICNQAKFSRCRTSCHSRSKNSRRGKFLKIPHSPLGRFSSTPRNICLKSSTTISSSASFRLRRGRKRYLRPLARGKFWASTSGHGFATTKGCSTTACAAKTTTIFRPVRTTSSACCGWA